MIISVDSEMLTRHDYYEEAEARCYWCGSTNTCPVKLDDVVTPPSVYRHLKHGERIGERIIRCEDCKKYSSVSRPPKCSRCGGSLTRRRYFVKGDGLHETLCTKCYDMGAYLTFYVKSTYYEEQKLVKCSFCNEDIHPNYHCSQTHQFACYECLANSPAKFIVMRTELTNYTGD